MDIRHEMGGNMNILLDSEDLDRLQRHGSCQSELVADGAVLRTRVMRDEFTTEPIAQTDGHSIDVYVPVHITLPTEAKVCNMTPAAEFYFGLTGKIVLTGQVRLD